MSWTKEYVAANAAPFRGAWWFKPWYVKKGHYSNPEAMRPEGILHGAKGLEWPEYPGSYKPRWEDRSGVPGLYKPNPGIIGQFPAIRMYSTSARQRIRGSYMMWYFAIYVILVYGIFWLRTYSRFQTQCYDEEKFHRWGCTAYMQAMNDVRAFCQRASEDRCFRKYLDHLPGIDRCFYHQENMYFQEWMELGHAYKWDAYMYSSPRVPWYNHFRSG